MLNDPPQPPVFVIGADAEMFRYYVRQPLTVVRSPEQLDYALLNLPRFRVAYHDVEWNDPAQRQMDALLRRRCPATNHGVVRIYECGG